MNTSENSQNPLTPECVAEPLPEWLAEIGGVCLKRRNSEAWDCKVDHVERLLELCKAQREALEVGVAYLPFDVRASEKWDRARRLWEGK